MNTETIMTDFMNRAAKIIADEIDTEVIKEVYKIYWANTAQCSMNTTMRNITLHYLVLVVKRTMMVILMATH